MSKLLDSVVLGILRRIWPEHNQKLIQLLQEIQPLILVDATRLFETVSTTNGVTYKNLKVRVSFKELFIRENRKIPLEIENSLFLLMKATQHPSFFSVDQLHVLQRNCCQETVVISENVLQGILLLFEKRRILAFEFLKKAIEIFPPNTKQKCEKLDILWKHFYHLEAKKVPIIENLLLSLLEKTALFLPSLSLKVFKLVVYVATRAKSMNIAEKFQEVACKFDEHVKSSNTVFTFTECMQLLQEVETSALRSGDFCQLWILYFLNHIYLVNSSSIFEALKVASKLASKYHRQAIENNRMKDLFATISLDALMAILQEYHALFILSRKSIEYCFSLLSKSKKKLTITERKKAICCCILYRNFDESKSLAQYLVDTMSKMFMNSSEITADFLNNAVDLLSLYPSGQKGAYEPFVVYIAQLNTSSLVKLFALFHKCDRKVGDFGQEIASVLFANIHSASVSELCTVLCLLQSSHDSYKKEVIDALVKSILSAEFDSVQWRDALKALAEHHVTLGKNEDLILKKLLHNIEQIHATECSSIFHSLLKLRCNGQSLFMSLWNIYLCNLPTSRFLKNLPEMLVDRQIWMPECPLSANEMKHIEKCFLTESLASFSAKDSVRIAFSLSQLEYSNVRNLMNILCIEQKLDGHISKPLEAGKRAMPFLFFTLCFIHVSMTCEGTFYRDARNQIGKQIQAYSHVLTESMPQSRFEMLYVLRATRLFLSFPSNDPLLQIQRKLVQALPTYNLESLKDTQKVDLLYDLTFFYQSVFDECARKLLKHLTDSICTQGHALKRLEMARKALRM